MWSHPYIVLLRTPQTRALLLAGITARLPLGMSSLAILLLIQARTGSFAAAGLVTGALAAGYAIVAPVQGRLVDRFGQSLPLLVSVSVQTVALAALIVAALSGARVGVMVAAAVVVGATIPPVTSCQQALWSSVLRDHPRLLDTALAVEATLFDVFLIAGPLIVGLLTGAFGPAVAVAVSGGLLLIGTLWFASLAPSRSWRGSEQQAALAGPLAGPLAAIGIRTLLAVAAVGSMMFGALRLALTGFAEDLGAPAVTGLLLSVFGVGSLVGGLWYGAREWRLSADQRYVMLLGVAAVLLVPLVLGGPLPVMIVITMIAGMGQAPVTACDLLLIRQLAPEGTLAEAYGWIATAVFAGAASGSALAGFVVGAFGWRGGAVFAVGSAVAATAIALVRWRTLRPTIVAPA